MTAAKTSTGEKVWQGDPAGFTEAFLRAEEMESAGDLLGAYVLRASTFYSYLKRVNPLLAFWYFYQAKRWACRAATLAVQKGLSELSHGQCDVIGTILLRRFLFVRANPREATFFFDRGRMKQNIPPHSRALLWVGFAEAAYLIGDRTEATVHLQAALEEEANVQAEQDWVQAMRQFIRVLRRAFVLYDMLGDKRETINLYLKATAFAQKLGWQGKEQLREVEKVWDRLQYPRPWHRLLPS